MPLPRAGMLKPGAFAPDAESRARFAAGFWDNATVTTVFAAGSIPISKLAGSVGAGINWQGPWSSLTAYNIDDAVEYKGASYIAIAVNTNDSPPSANWDLLAAPGITWRGAWSNVTAYQPGDAVAVQGSSYFALNANTNDLPPSVNWDLLASRGDGFTWRGTWSSLITYAVNDVVQSQGSAYLAITPNLNSMPPNAPWQLFAAGSGGDVQIFGVPGPPGPAGGPADGTVSVKLVYPAAAQFSLPSGSLTPTTFGPSNVLYNPAGIFNIGQADRVVVPLIGIGRYDVKAGARFQGDNSGTFRRLRIAYYNPASLLLDEEIVELPPNGIVPVGLSAAADFDGVAGGNYMRLELQHDATSTLQVEVAFSVRLTGSGPQGIPGQQGAPGPAGGPQGNTGLQGAQGNSGPPGVTSSAGARQLGPFTPGVSSGFAATLSNLGPVVDLVALGATSFPLRPETCEWHVGPAVYLPGRDFSVSGFNNNIWSWGSGGPPVFPLGATDSVFLRYFTTPP